MADVWVEYLRSLIGEELWTNSFYSGRPPYVFQVLEQQPP